MSTDESRRVRTRVALFGRESLNETDIWRWDNIRREEEHAKARKQRAQERERREQDLAHAGAHEEIAVLRADLAALRGELESLSRTVADTLNETANVFQTLTDERREQRAEFDDLKVAVAKLSSTEPHGRSADFKFAREKD